MIKLYQVKVTYFNTETQQEYLLHLVKTFP